MCGKYKGWCLDLSIKAMNLPLSEAGSSMLQISAILQLAKNDDKHPQTGQTDLGKRRMEAISPWSRERWAAGILC